MVTIKDAQEAAASIAQAMDPLSVVVFGSVAREGRGKDVDLLIVLDDHAENSSESDRKLYRVLKKYYRRFSIEPFVVTRSSLREYYFKGSPFLATIQNEGRLLYMKNAADEWLRQSGEEFETSRYLVGGEFFKGACYHAQQSIEKAMKAALLSRGWMLEKIHSVARLAALWSDHGIKGALTEEEILFIDGIYRGRYPAEEGLLPLGSPGKDDAARALRIAAKVLKKTGAVLKK
jgi:HEPN domain-containing protein/predicted nucleotidyltransferase